MFNKKRWKKATRQERTNAKNLGCFLILILAFVFASILTTASKTPKEYLYPRGTPKKHSLIQKVEAQEPTPTLIPNTWDINIKTIVDEFKDLGKEKTLKAIRIAYCESKWEEKAFNSKNTDGSNDAGVFQWNSIHNLPDETRFNAKKNIELAKVKVQAEGDFYAWACNF